MAMALFVLAQGLVLHAQGAGHGANLFGQLCEKPAAQLTGGHAPAPASVAHDCADCLACAFSYPIGARAHFNVGPTVSSVAIAAPADSASAPVFRWRAAHPARAPPLFS